MVNTVVIKEVPEIELNQEELHCSLWRKLEILLDDRLRSARRQNDANITLEQTANMRGRISELKRLRTLLAMDAPSPAPLAHGASPESF